ncbi:MAG: hypothetical protein HKN47_07440 [Pirellulaceae bacterium]|nr:hypothetical protein [Pirellulaceae bacterium]
MRKLLGVVAIAAVVCLIGTWILRSRANDFWGYGNYGVGDGSIASPVYYIEVRGVGSIPTFARVIRFSDHNAAPANVLQVGHGVSAEIRAHVQNADRWNGNLTLIAGRTLDEKVGITLDQQTAKQFFAPPGKQTRDYRVCVKLWDEHIAPHLAPEPES